MSARPKVAVIGTGGTIASTGAHPLDIVDYAGPMLDLESLLERVPALGEVADIVPVQHATIASDAFAPSDWRRLHGEIDQALVKHPDVEGVVITHGTATLEETAYFLNLTLVTDRPVVIVGAQRPLTGLSTDAPLNLVNAVRVAGSAQARGLGVLVVMNDEIHAAREVGKRSVFRLGAFESPAFGALGHADMDAIHIYRRPTRKHTTDTEFDLRNIGALPRVDIVACYAGGDGTAVDAFVAAGAGGLVLSALAPGTAPPGQRDALSRALERGVALAYSTRAGSGRAIKLESQQLQGSVTADNLTPQKARVLLMLALCRDNDPQYLQSVFDEY